MTPPQRSSTLAIAPPAPPAAARTLHPPSSPLAAPAERPAALAGPAAAPAANAAAEAATAVDSAPAAGSAAAKVREGAKGQAHAGASAPAAAHAPAGAIAPATASAPAAAPAPAAEEAFWEALAPEGLYVRALRPLFDLALLAVALPPALVLVALVAAANAIAQRDPRKIFFVQPRAGLRGKVFRLVKFRTMREVSDPFASWGEGDRLRVTPFGKLLRNTHLDELPQLWNVLCGHMSFIGPRPEMLEVEHWARAHVPGFHWRLAVKPGITGLAQVTQGYTGRDVDAYAEKLRINLAYLRIVSPRLDLWILLRTFGWMASGRGWSWDKPKG